MRQLGARGARYVQVAAGGGHTAVVLRSGGRVAASGDNSDRQCDLKELDLGARYLPELELRARYAQVSAGRCHTVLLRSHGRAVACGPNHDGE